VATGKLRFRRAKAVDDLRDVAAVDDLRDVALRDLNKLIPMAAHLGAAALDATIDAWVERWTGDLLHAYYLRAMASRDRRAALTAKRVRWEIQLRAAELDLDAVWDQLERARLFRPDRAGE
jgi:hypothetical protein